MKRNFSIPRAAVRKPKEPSYLVVAVPTLLFAVMGAFITVGYASLEAHNLKEWALKIMAVGLGFYGTIFIVGLSFTAFYEAFKPGTGQQGSNEK